MVAAITNIQPSTMICLRQKLLSALCRLLVPPWAVAQTHLAEDTPLHWAKWNITADPTRPAVTFTCASTSTSASPPHWYQFTFVRSPHPLRARTPLTHSACVGDPRSLRTHTSLYVLQNGTEYSGRADLEVQYANHHSGATARSAPAGREEPHPVMSVRASDGCPYSALQRTRP